MEPIYLDLHIHTSENEEALNKNYDVKTLLNRIKETSIDSTFLISLTDHNTINKSAYIALLSHTNNIILGVELHIRSSIEKPPYHCHMYFDIQEITEAIIDDINKTLDQLYPIKQIKPPYETVKNIEEIIRKFDKYEFLLLPHGGQSHSTFDKAVDSNFDTRLEKSLYYNQFDGFTARNERGLEDTINYFKRLGISEFVNLITCSDNYNPVKYPNAKDNDASPFIPTWMFAEPTFDGLRLSLSECSRLQYSNAKPTSWSEYIKKVDLTNEKIKIDVKLTPGLNVVIGGSSSGKTLFVDGIACKTSNNFTDSNYLDFDIENISINNPSQVVPHYISQNYIMKVLGSDNSGGIQEIDIIKKVFPNEESVVEIIRTGLTNLKSDVNDLISYVEKIEKSENEIKRIPILSRLILNTEVKINPLELICPKDDLISQIDYIDSLYKIHTDNINEIENFMINNPFITFNPQEFSIIKSKLQLAYDLSKFEKKIRLNLQKGKDELNALFLDENKESQTKKNEFDKLLIHIKIYSQNLLLFKQKLLKIQNYAITSHTENIISMGHILCIENKFALNKELFLDVLNKHLKSEHRVNSIETLQPNELYFDKCSQRNPKVRDYEDLANKIYEEFEKLNKRIYKITTKDGRDFDKLSAGWKTSVILDLILGYDKDIAPLIIDQPEDNLATHYINHGLIDCIKQIKEKKQVIIVSHNATIPMLGDAQNIILCENNNGFINIVSSSLEGSINNKSVVDHIAEITDGGKPSIKKRVKKYNMKSFKEDL